MTNKDAFEKKQQIRETYRYDEMSNKVLKADKSLHTVKTDPLKDAEESQPKSMSGRITVKEMGRAAIGGGTLEDQEEIARQIAERTNTEDNQTKKPKTYTVDRPSYGLSSILDSDNLPALKYIPTNAESIEVYQEILEWTTDLLGNDMPHDIILGTADLLIRELKNKEDEADGKIDKKRDMLQHELGMPLSAEKFQALVRLTQQITDFGTKQSNGDKAVAILGDDPEDQDSLNGNGREEYSLGDLEGEDVEEVVSEKELSEKKNSSQPPRNLEEEVSIIHSGQKQTGSDTISIIEVDEFFVRRKVLQTIENTELDFVQKISEEILALLENMSYDGKTLGEQLVAVLDFEYLELVEFMVHNRIPIIWGMRLSKCPPQQRQGLLQEMCDQGLGALVDQYNRTLVEDSKRGLEDINGVSLEGSKRLKNADLSSVPPLTDLGSLEFTQGAKLMTVTKVELPEGSYKKVTPLYEEIHIPPPISPEYDHELVPVSSFPEWAREAFAAGETDTLNIIQSKVFPTAFRSDVNMLICAPTGGGKTNVAIMSMLRTISKYFDPVTNKLDLGQFKIVYIAPLKALVQEQVRELQRRLAYLGIKVEELTGDSNLTKQQMAETQVLVSTPEKWDIVTRKAGESFSNSELVQLIIIDEIHLLHDRRGPVIESIVARSFNSNIYLNLPRLVGLSATLPNYEDVARFLRVPESGLFFFDSSFRPCPLSQQFCGITEKSSIKKLKAMNEACYNKSLESLKNGHQVIIFVHSRKETARTSTWLREKFIESDNIGLIQKGDAGSKQILLTEAENIEDPNLKKVIQHGIGIHHAGLSKSDRSLSEDLFADGLLQILVSTATLAWGVNLPAHTVIVKGTDLYSPEKGHWEQLSPQDLLQMLGRAGRPRYDTHGEGVIITNQADVQYYLAVLNQQLSIESQFISTLVDNVNAEVVSGNIKSRSDAVRWLSYTYLYVRMLASPELYKCPAQDEDVTLIKYRESLAHSAFVSLHENGMVIYDEHTGYVEPTELGRIASYFYIKYTSMAMYSKQLTDHTSLIDLFRFVSMSEEFKYIAVRQEERKELKELLGTSPIPIKEDVDDPLAKVNILLQSYISRLKFDGFALNADMNYITQSAGRLLRALFELALKKKLANVSKMLLNMCKMVERRMWNANSPLRQFRKCPREVIKKTEASTIPWSDYLDLQSPAEVGRSIRSEKYGKMVFDLMQKFPKIELKCTVQPITSSLLKLELEILPSWIWDQSLHGRTERFVVLVEDTEGEKTLFYDTLLVKMGNIGQYHSLAFTLSIPPAQQKCLPPNIFVNVISEKWLNCECQLAIKIESIFLPKKFPAPTPLLDVPLTHISELNNQEFTNVFDFAYFNKFQSQVFQSVYNSNENVLIAAAKGSGKTTIAELAFLNHWRQNKGRAVYISPYQGQINTLYKKWSDCYSMLAGGKSVNKLGINLTQNLRIISQSHLVLATPEQFNLVSRRWRHRKNIQNIELMIYDDVHEIDRGLFGAVYEALISRMAFISNQIDNDQRLISLSSCLANGRDFAEWIGVNKSHFFNFSPHERVSPIEIHIQSFNNVSNVLFNKPMTKLAFEFAFRNSSDATMVFLPTKKSCFQIGSIFMEYAETASWRMLKIDEHDLFSYLNGMENELAEKYLTKGIGIIYDGMPARDKNIVEELYNHNALSFLLLTRECCIMSPISRVVAVLGTQYYNDKEHHYMNYSANNILEMVGSAGGLNSDQKGKVIILTSVNMKEYYKKFLSESLPLESHMYFHLHDLLSTEISTSVIQNKQDCIDWVAYTYFYRRLHANPSFYGLEDTSAYGISAYLTELVETALRDLQGSSIIEIVESDNKGEEEEKISPLNGCLISSHYDISFVTMNKFLSSLSGSSTLEDILLILSKASEFEAICVKEEDRTILTRLENAMPLRASEETRTNLQHYKIFVLLQAHFSRISLSSDLQIELTRLLKRAVPLINAIIDILSGDGKLNAMTAMDVSQMIIQGVWDTDSPLKQIPYFDQSILASCNQMKIETVFDIMALEDAERDQIMMSIDGPKLIEVANFINNYPNVELAYDLEGADRLEADQVNSLSVTLTRDEAPETLVVRTFSYPFEKLENWWLVLGEISTRELLAIKKVSIRHETESFELDFAASRGSHRLTLWCVCDSYLDADKEVSFDVNVL